MTHNKPTLSEILAEFKSAHSKTAEEAVVVSEESAPAEVCPECGQDPCICEAQEGPVDAGDLAAAADAVQEAEEGVVDAAAELRDIADEYIAQHDEALAKEAAVFGTLFADSVLSRIQERQDAEDAYTSSYMKTAAAMEEERLALVSAEAYSYALAKFAELEGEEPVEAEEPEEEVLPEWLQDAVVETSDALADQASTLGDIVDEYMSGGDEADEEPADEEPEGDTEDDAVAVPEEELSPEEQEAAAMAAYQAANEQFANQQDPQAAAMAAYQAANAQLGGEPVPVVEPQAVQEAQEAQGAY